MSEEDEEQEEYFTRMRKDVSYWGRLRARHPAGMRYKRARDRSELRTGWTGPLAVVGFLCLVFLVVWLLAR